MSARAPASFNVSLTVYQMSKAIFQVTFLRAWKGCWLTFSMPIPFLRFPNEEFWNCFNSEILEHSRMYLFVLQDTFPRKFHTPKI